MRVEFTKIIHLNEVLDEKQIQILNQLILKDMEKHQFKPFEQVLVRDYNNCPWKATHYSHYDEHQECHYCTDNCWNICIPYNENTAHLLGTCDPYEEPQPKTFHVVYENGKGHMFTDEEFKHFIETAVLNNKDVSHFAVHRL